MYKILRPALFKLDAERSHNLTLSLLDLTYGSAPWQRLAQPRLKGTPVTCMGLRFPNPVGLAAGLDKNADHLDGLGALGFGSIEVGTVTPRPQAGNQKPRLFRLANEEAIINRMGFNNKGVDHLVKRVQERRYRGILGINIGKNADTPLEDANEDYLICLNKVYPHADYVTVNISSPNTPGLRDLQHGNMLKDLFGVVKKAQADLAKQHGKKVPIAIKIAPDMTRTDIDEFAETALSFDIDAVIATNTTFSREGVEQSPYQSEAGGLSGKPLQTLATSTVSELGIRFAGRIPVIAAGGIDSITAAQDKLAAGATLLQVYTGLIYQGPSLAKRLIANCTSQENTQ